MTAPEPLRAHAEPFFFERGPVGVLLIHGYSGSPGELRPLGEALAARNYSVCAPLLAGHGTTPDALFKVTWKDWLASALVGLAQLRRRCPTVILAGFSMGALLAAVLAARIASAGVLFMAPALRLHGQPLVELTDIAGRIQPWYYPLARADFSNPSVQAAVRGFVPDADFSDAEMIAAMRKNAKVPIGSIYELVRLQHRARRDLPHVTAPTLIMQGRLDRTVNPISAELTYRLLGAAEKRLIWFEHSDHQLPRETEKEQVWAAAGDWIYQLRVQSAE